MFIVHYGLVNKLADSGRVIRMSGLEGGLNRSTQHFILEGKDGV
jgi:hypothetical protein